ncbi:MAG: hypothetical protein KAU31_03965, partial [Spirochaetaceae bacterium]|nr:hypothetical protein [Spirochaetaceae bacterium]
VRIPPGTYRLAVVVDPRTRYRKDAEHNNYLASRDRFFYAGGTDVEVFKVEITYNGEDSLDNANPIKVFIGDRTRYDRPGDWGRFRVPEDGQYYFPLDGVPRRDNDESGYFMLLVHDVGDDLEHPHRLDQHDVAGIYRDGSDSLMYGSITVLSGSPVYPGSFYKISFSIPSPPTADIYEAEEFGDFGTVVDYAALPIRQYHTFHPMAEGQSDRDWFRIFLRTGDKVTVETLSADGSWEADTQIDVCDSSHNYIRSNRDKAPDDNHSELTYVNDTGIDQVFCFLVKPADRTNNIAHFQTGEYVVEIRR